MGQIRGEKAKISACNIRSLSSFGIPYAGMHILVSTDNSATEDGQGYFDSYIIGDGTTAATALELHKYKAEELDEQINGTFVSYDASFAVTASAAINKSFAVSVPAGTYKVESNFSEFYTDLTVYFKKNGTNLVTKRMLLLISEGVTLPSDIDTIMVYQNATSSSAGTLTINLSAGRMDGSIVGEIEKLQELEVIPDILYGHDEVNEGVLSVTSGMTLSLANSHTDFNLPAGTYTINFDGGGVIPATTIYLRDANGNNISVTGANGTTLNKLASTNTGAGSVYQPITIPTDVAYLQFYGGTASANGQIRVYVDLGHSAGLIEKTEEVDERLTDVEQDYLSKTNIPFIKRLLYHADEVIPADGPANYRNKIVLTLTGEEINKDAMYVFTCDGPVEGVQNNTALQIIGADNSVYQGGLCNFHYPFAYFEPSKKEFDSGVSVDAVKFRLYPYNDGVVFRNVNVYVWEEYKVTNEIDVATTTISKLALAPHRISETCKSVAHRGYLWTAPQNMLSAVTEAKRQGYTATENDVAITADDHYVMWHDTTLVRLKMLRDINGYFMYADGNGNYYWYDADNEALYTWDGTQYVASSVSLSSLTQCNGADYSINTLTFAILKRLDFGSWKSAKYKGETIPTFDEWICYCKLVGINAWIDFKLTEQELTAAAEYLVGVVRKYGMLRNVVWIAGSSTRAIRSYDDKAVCALLVPPSSQIISAYADLIEQGGEGSIIFDPEWSALTQDNALLALNSGFGLSAWYVTFFPNKTDKAVIFQNIINTIKLGVQNFTLDIYTVEDVIYENYLK